MTIRAVPAHREVFVIVVMPPKRGTRQHPLTRWSIRLFVVGLALSALLHEARVLAQAVLVPMRATREQMEHVLAVTDEYREEARRWFRLFGLSSAPAERDHAPSRPIPPSESSSRALRPEGLADEVLEGSDHADQGLRPGCR
jgi:hypothetical protein